MGLQFGLGQSEYLAAVRQRHAINAAHFLPPAHCAGKLVLSVSLPASIDINKQSLVILPMLMLGKVCFVYAQVI